MINASNEVVATAWELGRRWDGMGWDGMDKSAG